MGNGYAGDPLSDLGLTLCYWVWATAPKSAWQASRRSRPARLVHRDELVERYAQSTGRDVTHIGYYEVLGVFKLAVIVQQIYCRFHRGQTHDERFQDFGARAAALGRLASRLAGR